MHHCTKHSSILCVSKVETRTSEGGISLREVHCKFHRVVRRETSASGRGRRALLVVDDKSVLGCGQIRLAIGLCTQPVAVGVPGNACRIARDALGRRRNGVCVSILRARCHHIQAVWLCLERSERPSKRDSFVRRNLVIRLVSGLRRLRDGEPARRESIIVVAAAAAAAAAATAAAARRGGGGAGVLARRERRRGATVDRPGRRGRHRRLHAWCDYRYRARLTHSLLPVCMYGANAHEHQAPHAPEPPKHGVAPQPRRGVHVGPTCVDAAGSCSSLSFNAGCRCPQAKNLQVERWRVAGCTSTHPPRRASYPLRIHTDPFAGRLC